MTEAINLKEFFTMMATEVVNDISKADVIVSDEEIDENINAQIFRSYDIDKILKLLNN